MLIFVQRKDFKPYAMTANTAHQQPTALHSRSLTAGAPEIISIDEQDQNENGRLQPSRAIESSKSVTALGDMTPTTSDDLVSDTLPCPPWNYQTRNIVYPCKSLATNEKTIADDKPKSNVRVIPLPIKKHLTVGYVPGLPGGTGERPQIRFGGLYLEKFGFMVGKKVCMQIEPNRITLTADQAESNSAE